MFSVATSLPLLIINRTIPFVFRCRDHVCMILEYGRFPSKGIVGKGYLFKAFGAETENREEKRRNLANC